MSRLLRNPRIVAALAIFVIVSLVSVAGGALGSAFGGGFLGSPIAHIQLPAESVTAGPVFLGFKITNTMVTTWITIVLLVILSILATRRMNDVPVGLQNVVEAIFDFFLDLCEKVAGPERARRFFPLVVTIFLFIVAANWMGVLPGFGTIGRIESRDDVVHHAEAGSAHPDLNEIKLQVFDGDGAVGVMAFGSVDGEITVAEYDREGGAPDGKQAGVLVPFLRSANTEVNTTLAIALVAMFMVHLWGFRTLGIRGHVSKFLNFKGGPIGLFVGILEGISEIARVISFTFRLFGNIFAGEVLLVAIAFLLPLIGLIPFLGLELFVGLIQAFIFSILTLVFATMATVSHGAEGH